MRESRASRCPARELMTSRSPETAGEKKKFRVERTGRSANWILANYLTQASPETFCTCGGARSNGTLITLF